MEKRLYFVDQLRIFLTMLVLIHHTAITYGAAGGWYYEDVDKTQMTVTSVVLTLFTAVNQSFFMGLFFFISGYFTPRSLDRKGTYPFLKDRFIRLGIPLLVFFFLLGPLVTYMASYSRTYSFFSYYMDKVLSFQLLNFGPLWFVEALLIFNVVYALFRQLVGTATRQQAPLSFPSGKGLLIAALLLGLIAFIIRLVFPTGSDILGMQPGYFPCYILLFYCGIAAYRNNWLERLPQRTVLQWLWISLASIPVLPIVLVVTGALDGNLTFAGGMNLQALTYAMWEPFVAFGICLNLLALFSRRLNRTGPLPKALSDSSYTAYIIHPLVIVGLSLMLHHVSMAPIIKLVLVGAMGIIICYYVSYLILKIPYARRIL